MHQMNRLAIKKKSAYLPESSVSFEKIMQLIQQFTNKEKKRKTNQADDEKEQILSPQVEKKCA